jgi:hypothetical protein
MTNRPNNRFRRRFRGYDVNLVEDFIERLELRTEDLEHEAGDLRDSLQQSKSEAAEAKHDLARARAELRYWNDRASYVDSEVARARRHAVELEQTARERADAIEADAQERSIQLIDRVCTEANGLLVAAREEAREMFLRFETDVDMSQQKLDQLERARRQIAGAMSKALTQFSDAVRDMERVAPAQLLVEASAQPARRAKPSFGRAKAIAAAKNFEDTRGTDSAAALSSPLTAQVSDSTPAEDATSKVADEVVVAAEPVQRVEIELPEITANPAMMMQDPQFDLIAIEHVPSVTSTSTGAKSTTGPSTPPVAADRKTHEPDEEFAALLLIP